LTINEERSFSYKTVYFDTPTNEFFLAHHNNKLNRLKIRRRTYINTGTSFLELKLKTNKGRTVKKRIKTNDIKTFSIEEKNFIHNNTSLNFDEIQPSLTNKFSRITFVSKDLNERYTIDFDISFKGKNTRTSLENIVILEIKLDGKNRNSKITKLLKESMWI